jgi:hypothetical protein
MNILLISSIIGIIIGIIGVYFIYKKKPTPKQKSTPKMPKTPASSPKMPTPTPSPKMPSPAPSKSMPSPTPSGYDWEGDLTYSEINQIQLYDWTLYNNKETVKTEMDNDKLYRN